MARKLRVQYPGAIYHAMNRGDRREAIFNDDNDRLLFLDFRRASHESAPSSPEKQHFPCRDFTPSGTAEALTPFSS